MQKDKHKRKLMEALLIKQALGKKFSLRIDQINYNHQYNDLGLYLLMKKYIKGVLNRKRFL